MAAGVTNKLWEVSDLVALWEEVRAEGRKSGVNKRILKMTALAMLGLLTMNFKNFYMYHVMPSLRQNVILAIASIPLIWAFSSMKSK